MALINCPECGKQVSHQAIICPNCGYKVMNYVNQIRIEHSITTMKCKTKTASMRILRKIKKILKPAIIASVSIFLILLVVNCIGAMFFYLQPEPELDIFEYVSSNKYEPLALTAENNIMGKDISVVLDEVFKDKAYSYRSDGDTCSYSFSEQIAYPIGDNAELTIHADANNNLVHIVEYSFMYPFSNSGSYMLYRLLHGITEHYQVEPSSTYMDDEGNLVDFSTESLTAYMKKNKHLYFIIWDIGDLRVALYVPNITDSESVYCSIIFLDTSIRNSISSQKIKYLQHNSVGGTTALRKDTASQAHCIIFGEYYQLNLGGMIHEKIHNVFA